LKAEQSQERNQRVLQPLDMQNQNPNDIEGDRKRPCDVVFSLDKKFEGDQLAVLRDNLRKNISYFSSPKPQNESLYLSPANENNEPGVLGKNQTWNSYGKVFGTMCNARAGKALAVDFSIQSPAKKALYDVNRLLYLSKLGPSADGLNPNALQFTPSKTNARQPGLNPLAIEFVAGVECEYQKNKELSAHAEEWSPRSFLSDSDCGSEECYKSAKNSSAFECTPSPESPSSLEPDSEQSPRFTYTPDRSVERETTDILEDSQYSKSSIFQQQDRDYVCERSLFIDRKLSYDRPTAYPSPCKIKINENSSHLEIKLAKRQNDRYLMLGNRNEPVKKPIAVLKKRSMGFRGKTNLYDIDLIDQLKIKVEAILSTKKHEVILHLYATSDSYLVLMISKGLCEVISILDAELPQKINAKHYTIRQFYPEAKTLLQLKRRISQDIASVVAVEQIEKRHEDEVPKKKKGKSNGNIDFWRKDERLFVTSRKPPLLQNNRTFDLQGKKLEKTSTFKHTQSEKQRLGNLTEASKEIQKGFSLEEPNESMIWSRVLKKDLADKQDFFKPMEKKQTLHPISREKQFLVEPGRSIFAEKATHIGSKKHQKQNGRNNLKFGEITEVLDTAKHIVVHASRGYSACFLHAANYAELSWREIRAIYKECNNILKHRVHRFVSEYWSVERIGKLRQEINWFLENPGKREIPKSLWSPTPLIQAFAVLEQCTLMVIRRRDRGREKNDGNQRKGKLRLESHSSVVCEIYDYDGKFTVITDPNVNLLRANMNEFRFLYWIGANHWSFLRFFKKK